MSAPGSSGVSIKNGVHGKTLMCALFNNLCIRYRHNFFERNYEAGEYFGIEYVYIFALNVSEHNYKLSIMTITYFYSHLPSL